MDKYELNSPKEEEDDFAKQLEEELEKESNGYIDKFEYIKEKSDDELLQMSKEEILTYKNLQITQLKSYVNSLEKEKEDLINDFKITTDALIEKIKDNEFINNGIRPQTPMIKLNKNTNINNKNNPNEKIKEKYQRCPNCTKEILISDFIEHSLQCLRKIFRCHKCNSMMPILEKENHFLFYQNIQKIINSIETNDENFFKQCIIHDFDINNCIFDNEKNDKLIHFLVKKNKVNFLKILFRYSNNPENININIKNKSDMSPLMICCQFGFIEMAKEIIKKGGDVNDKNILGDTPVRIAQNNKHESLAFMLINDYKANISKF